MREAQLNSPRGCHSPRGHRGFRGGACFVAAEEGSTLIELGLVLPVVIAIILGATQLAFYMQRSMLVVEAASVGARFGIIAGNATNTAGMQQAASNSAGSLSGFQATATTFCSCSPGGAQINCSSTCSSLATPSHYVQVTTSAMVPGLFKITRLPASLTPTATSTMRASWPGQ